MAVYDPVAALAALRVRMPEFGQQTDAYVQSFLDSSAALHDPVACGNSLQELIIYHAALGMALTPAGFTAGISTERFGSTYEARYNMILRRVCGGPRITSNTNADLGPGPFYPGDTF